MGQRFLQHIQLLFHIRMLSIHNLFRYTSAWRPMVCGSTELHRSIKAWLIKRWWWYKPMHNYTWAPKVKERSFKQVFERLYLFYYSNFELLMHLFPMCICRLLFTVRGGSCSMSSCSNFKQEQLHMSPKWSKRPELTLFCKDINSPGALIRPTLFGFNLLHEKQILSQTINSTVMWLRGTQTHWAARAQELNTPPQHNTVLLIWGRFAECALLFSSPASQSQSTLYL